MKCGTIQAKLNIKSEFGEVTQNTNYGLYGKVTNISNLINKQNEYEVQSKWNVKIGKASIFLDIDGTGNKKYEVEIDGIDYFDKNQNIHIKVTDKELINLTGGIVKGMSGTPIIQDGKFIGAINYVSENNPKDAYAIFADKLF